MWTNSPANFIRRSEVWLIFDDLSTILEDQQFTDKGIELLFSSLRYNAHNAKVIVTSRILPMLENGESLIDVVEEEEKQNLKGLKKDFAVDYLARNGLSEVEPEKLERTGNRCGWTSPCPEVTCGVGKGIRCEGYT